jgi:hypothetical protein
MTQKIREMTQADKKVTGLKEKVNWTCERKYICILERTWNVRAGNYK